MTVYKNNISKLFTKTYSKLFLLLFFLFSNHFFAQLDNNLRKITNLKKNINASVPVKNNDSLKIPKDSTSVKNDSIIPTTLKYQLTHYAEDYTEINQKKKFIKLYNKAHIQYQDIDLTAGVIYVDYAKNEVYAGRIPDSLGHLSQRPVFKQGKTETENDSIRFNFKTKKALVWNTYTKEGEFSMISSVTKKYNDSVIFVKNVKFTTSTDKEHPEYYFLAKKGKIVPGKKIVIGTTQMWIEDVATPLMIPFGFFPLTETRTSGFLMPTFADTQLGYALSDGGFYWAINPYMDLTVTGDIYTNGSYGLQLNTRYMKRYRFSGDFRFKYNNTIQSELPEFVQNKEWRINWTHRNDSKSSPLRSFTANVDLGSQKYYRDSYNYNDIINTNNRLNNDFGSSVSYQQRFANLPINFSLNLNHNQNVNTGKISMTLPHLNLNVSRIYPFAKNGMKKNALQRINFTYRLDAQQKIVTSDSLFFKSQMWHDAESGAMHTIPISTNLKIFKYFNLQPQLTYKEVWVMQSIDKQWNPSANNGNGGEEIIKHKGLTSYRDFNGSLNLSTTIYGTYLFGNNHFFQGIRHTMKLGFSAGYHPVNNNYIKRYFNPVNNQYIDYTIYDNGLYGTPNINESKSIIASLSNDFEAKIKTKDGKSKKIRFLTATTGYNFLADSLKIAKINLRSTATIIQGFTVNMGALYDFYALDDTGKNIDKFALQKNQGIGRIQNFRISTGYNFSNATFNKKNKKQNNPNKDKETAELYVNNIKWSLRVNYSFNYQNKAYHPDNLWFNEISTHVINFAGKFSFSPSWDISYRSGYDLVKKDFSFTNFTFNKDLKSWNMSLVWNPMKPSYWYFKIGIKSPVLNGIKYDKRKEPFHKYF